jgi:hypothetical protein
VLPHYNGRNRSFFFLGWQGTQIRNVANSLSTFAPTFDEREGNFSTCGKPCTIALKDPLGGLFPGNQIPVSRFDPASVKVNTFIPAVAGTGQTVIGRPINWKQNQGVLKLDHQMGDKDRLSARYFIDQFENAGTYDPSNLLSYSNPTLVSSVRSQSGVITWTRTISASLLNDFHFGFNRIYAQRFPPNNVPSMQDFGVRLPIYPSKPSISQINPSGFFNIGDNLEGRFPRTAFEWSNQTSWVYGHHTLQFGGMIQRTRDDIINEFRRAGHFVFNGNITGMAMSDYFLGGIGTFDQGTGEYKAFRATFPALFVQDDWKVRPRLTLNLGVRYEPEQPFNETRGRINVFSIEAFNAGVKSPQFDNSPIGETFRGDPNTPYNGTEGDYNNVAARVGFAYDVFGDGKTSFRGGVGMFYDQHQDTQFNNNSVDNPPWSIRESITQPQGPFSDPYRGRTDFNAITLQAIGAKDATFPKPIIISTYDARQETPLTYNWNMAVEREVVPEWLARIAYVGSASMYGRTTKQFDPAVYAAGATTATTDARRLFASGNIGNVDYYTQDRRAHYHSLQLSLTKRFSHGFTILTNYTRAKSIDNYGDYVEPWYFPNGDQMQKGPSDYDHANRFVISYVWELPKMSSSNGFTKYVVNGWQWTGIGQYQTGSPFNIKSGRDNSLTGLGNDRPKLTGDSTDPAAGADKRVWFNSAAFAVNDLGTFGTLGRNVLRGPSLFSWDMGLFKTFAFTERFQTQFRAEFFNIFNQTNFDNPNTTVTGGGFGTITKTVNGAGDPRIIQFGLKFAF